MGVLESPGKVLDFSVSKRVGTLSDVGCSDAFIYYLRQMNVVNGRDYVFVGVCLSVSLSVRSGAGVTS